ncbi:MULTISPECIES: ArdC family protein [Streptosporangium]|uniref:N-terminal domain-containing protein n=1 Tax=Streptosporangium brasiliense TaxID=47480 RepID=A0ABT9RNF9_9ACTN|nr:ArdC family protein [Streptosporangium brasiliense]MDP9870382.1 hypothetical protein [Streptosporangium brasiliense]
MANTLDNVRGLSALMITSLRNLAVAGGSVAAFLDDMRRAGVNANSVQALKRRGLVEKNTPTDRSNWAYVITDLGRAALAEIDGQQPEPVKPEPKPEPVKAAAAPAKKSTTAKNGKKKTGKKKSGRFSLTPEERAKRMQEAHEALTAAVETLTTAEGWAEMLRFRASLRKYSLNNTLFLRTQMPEATDVRPLSEWNKLGRTVIKGSKSLKVWAPRTKKADTMTVTETDAATGQETEITLISGFDSTRFFLVPVFDISQTEGEPVPTAAAPIPQDLTGDAPAWLWDALAAQVEARGYTLERGDAGSAEAFVNFAERRVVVKGHQVDAQAVTSLTHELAHIMCEHNTRGMSREAQEVEAESVSFVVATVAGIESAQYAVPYVAGWGKDVKAVKDSAARVLQVSNEILSALGFDAKSPTDQDAAALAA